MSHRFDNRSPRTSGNLHATISFITGAILALGIALPAAAHHSAAFFDFTQRVPVDGVVQSLRVENPHTLLVMTVSDDKGTRDITFAGHSRNNVYRRGWRPDMVHEGDKIKIYIAPTKDGSDGGYIHAFELADGREF